MEQPNTKKHWTALAVARYYDAHETACRARDLWPYVKEIHDRPHLLTSTLGQLDDEDVIDHIVVESPQKDGSRSNVFAYFPTLETLQGLQSLGEPTKLPDGSAIPDGVNPQTPDSHPSGEVPPPDNRDATGLDYPPKTRAAQSSGTRAYDASERHGEPDAEVLPETADHMDDTDTDTETETDSDADTEVGLGSGPDDDDDRDATDLDIDIDAVMDTATNGDTDDETETDGVEMAVCEGCGKEFDTRRQVTGHQSHCDEYLEMMDDDEPRLACEGCGAEFDSVASRNAHEATCAEYRQAAGFLDADVSHVCEGCGEEFAAPQGLGSHQMSCDAYQEMDADADADADTDADSEDDTAAAADDAAADEDDTWESEPVEYVCDACGATFDSPQGLGGHSPCDGPDDDADADADTASPSSSPSEPAAADIEPEIAEFDSADGLNTDSIPQPGRNANEVDWRRVARDLESRSNEAKKAGLVDIASAYSQFATLAIEENLDAKTAYILLGVPVGQFETDAVSQALD